MLKHEFKVFLVAQHIEILDLPAFLGKGLPGRCGERSRVFSKNKDLLGHGKDLLLGTGLCFKGPTYFYQSVDTLSNAVEAC